MSSSIDKLPCKLINNYLISLQNKINIGYGYSIAHGYCSENKVTCISLIMSQVFGNICSFFVTNPRDKYFNHFKLIKSLLLYHMREVIISNKKSHTLCFYGEGSSIQQLLLLLPKIIEFLPELKEININILNVSDICLKHLIKIERFLKNIDQSGVDINITFIHGFNNYSDKHVGLLGENLSYKIYTYFITDYFFNISYNHILCGNVKKNSIMSIGYHKYNDVYSVVDYIMHACLSTISILLKISFAWYLYPIFCILNNLFIFLTYKTVSLIFNIKFISKQYNKISYLMPGFFVKNKTCYFLYLNSLLFFGVCVSMFMFFMTLLIISYSFILITVLVNLCQIVCKLSAYYDFFQKTLDAVERYSVFFKKYNLMG